MSARDPSSTTVHADGFSVTTRIAARPDAVYRAWTVKDHVEGWLATTAEIDARVGGRYVYRWPTDGGELSARGEYLELVPGRRIVQTWESWGPEGRFEGGDATLEIDLVDRGDGTTDMTQTERSPAYDDPARIEMSMNGTIESHGALARFIELQEAGK